MPQDTFLPEGMRIATRENKEALSSPLSLERAMLTEEILEAPVLLCDGEFTLHVELGCMRGVIPREEAMWCRQGESAKDIAILTRVGKPVCFVVTGFAQIEGERVALLSRRAAQERCAAHLFRDVAPGDILPARVTHLEPYGAFLDIGCGIASLLSIDCISVSRIAHPRDRISCGMQLDVAVRSIDRALLRVFVTLKELLGTWAENAAQFHVGETVTGRVRSIESYGVFVELAPNLAGLAELPQGDTSTETRVGDLAAVYIKSILPERMKVKLVIIDSHPSPAEITVPRYYVDTSSVSHISRWVYSPTCSARLIETVFA